MGRELKICDRPPIIYAIYGGVRLGIILGQNSPNVTNWFYNNHIQLLSTNLTLSHGGIDHLIQFQSFKDYTYRFFLKEIEINEQINRDINRLNVLDYILSYINAGYYVQAYVDVSKIHGIRYDSKKPMAHSFFITGYDLNELCLFHWDYDEQGKFHKLDTSMDDFLEAFCSDELGRDLQRKGLAKKYYFKLYKFEDREYPFSLDYLVDQFQAYINSKNISYYSEPFLYGENICFGMDCWNNVEQYINGVENYIDERLLKVILEHKQVMKKRIDFLLEKNFLKNIEIMQQYNKLEEMAKKFQILGLKYNLVNKTEYLDAIKKNIEEMRVYEYKLYQELINIL